MKTLIFIILLFWAIFSYAQNTTITATIVDQSGQAYANGTWKVDFFPAPGVPGPYTQQGQPFQKHFSGVLTSNGSFTVTVASNASIVPAKSQWTFQVCPNATYACTTTTQTVNGATLDMSANISNFLPPSLSDINPTPNFNAAYSNLNIGPPSRLVDGSAYFNTTNGTPCWFYQGSFTCISNSSGGPGGPGSVPISSLTPAIATNSINNGNFAQRWQWQLTGVAPALSIGESVASTTVSAQVVDIFTLPGSTASAFRAAVNAGTGNPIGLQVQSNGNIMSLGGAPFVGPHRATNITGTTQCVQADASGNLLGTGTPCSTTTSGGIQSINSDTTPAQRIVGGGAVSVATASGTTIVSVPNATTPNQIINASTGAAGSLAVWQTGSTCGTNTNSYNICSSTFNIPGNPFRNSFMVICSPGPVANGSPHLVTVGPAAVNPTNQIQINVMNGTANGGVVSSFSFLTCYAFGT